MTRKKRYLIGAAVGALLIGTGTAKAIGIPVIDAAALTELIAQLQASEKAFALQVSSYVLQAKQFVGENFSWVTQYGQYLTQIAHYYNDAMELLSLAHHPTFGAAMSLMNQAGLTNDLPFNPYSAMNLINGSSYNQGIFSEVQGILGALSNFAGTSYQANQLYTPTDGSWASDQLQANASGIAGSQGVAMASYEAYRNHMGVLPSLRQNAASSDTTKDAVDSGNQIAIETAWNLNQLGQVNAMHWMAEQQRLARQQRDEERLACELEMFRTTGAPCPTGKNGASAGGGGSVNGGSDAMPVPPVPPLIGVGGNPIAMAPQMPAPPVPPVQPPAFDPPAPPPNQQVPANPPPQPQPTQGNLQ